MRKFAKTGLSCVRRVKFNLVGVGKVLRAVTTRVIEIAFSQYMKENDPESRLQLYGEHYVMLINNTRNEEACLLEEIRVGRSFELFSIQWCALYSFTSRYTTFLTKTTRPRINFSLCDYCNIGCELLFLYSRRLKSLRSNFSNNYYLPATVILRNIRVDRANNNENEPII